MPHNILAKDPGPLGTDPDADSKPSFIQRVNNALRKARIGDPLSYATTLHPCLVDGKRTLVHRRELANEQPDIFSKLVRYAKKHGFRLLADRRNQQLACRDERRRLAPVLMFSAGLVAASTVSADNQVNGQAVDVVPTIDVVGQTEAESRPYLIQAGKRFVSSPYGEIDLILKVAEKVRDGGEKKRIMTRGMQMPSEFAGSFVDRYDYQMPEECGGQRFSYYEGDGFAALGYRSGRGKIVLDVLAGGGPFTGPRLWGPYDQILNSNTKMQLMFGDGEGDGMGLLKASYKIGLMPVMKTGTKDYYGELYSRAVAEANECRGGLPKVLQADATPAEDGDPS
ncbi:MAG: hypothetical protein AAF384_10115 [Pseudomonadota bacterium]